MKYLAKKVLALALTGALTLSMLPAQILAVGDGGKGTKEDPYQLSAPSDLELLRENSNSYFVLKNNIEMQGESFTPIEQPFTGTLDGAGFAIQNLKIKDDYAAFFVEIANKGTGAVGVVKNISFANATILGKNAAAVVACVNNGFISNVRVQSGTVSATDAAGRAGAMAARVGNGGVIQKSGSTAAVMAAVAGGLVGLTEGGTIQTSYVGGKVSGLDKDSATGSVFGTFKANPASETLSTSHVYYNTGATTLLTAGQDSKGGVYANKGLISVTLNIPAELAAGSEGESPALFSAQPSPAMVTFSSSNADVLTVDKASGNYLLKTEGTASYQVNFMFDATAGFFYTMAANMPYDGKEANDTPAASSSQAQSASSEAGQSSAAASSDGSSSASKSEPVSAAVSEAASSAISSEASSSSTAASNTTSQAVSSSSAAASSSDVSSSEAVSGSAPSGSESAVSSEEDSKEEIELPPEDVVVTGAWQSKEGEIYYVYNDGTKAIGPQTIDNQFYIFDANGAVKRYGFKYENAEYLANQNGVLYINSLLLQDNFYTYYNATGAATLGWQPRSGNRRSYQYENAAGRYVMAKGVRIIENVPYLFSTDSFQITGTGWTEGVYLKDSIVATGRQSIDGKTYVFSPEGRPYVGEFTHGGKNYYADDTGAICLDDFRTLPEGTLRYYNDQGACPTGWFDHDGGRYYQNTTLQVLTGRQGVEGTVYFFGSDGRLTDTDGWAGDYYVQDGEALIGKQPLEGKTYIFDETGLVKKGAFVYENEHYYGDETGALYKEAIVRSTENGAAYYGQDGKAVKSAWIDLDGNRYYQNAEMQLVTGKQVIDEATYFFEADGKQKTTDGWAGNCYVKNGRAVTGLQEIDGKTYIFSNTGAVNVGEFAHSGAQYFADETGALYQDYIRTLPHGAKRYYGANGRAEAGWADHAGERYYQSKTLELVIGEQKIDHKTYYFSLNGRLIQAGWMGNYYVRDGLRVTGPQTIDEQRYIFSNLGLAYKFEFMYEGAKYLANSTGRLYTNSFLSRGENLTYFDIEGAARKGWIDRKAAGKYYHDDNFFLLTGQQEIEGATYFFSSEGKLSTTDGWAGDYYVKDGAAVLGLQQIDGKTYIFNEKGLVQKGEFAYQGDAYHADTKGALYQNTIRTLKNGSLSYYDADGKAVKDQWVELDGKRYYQTKEFVLAVGRHTVGGQVYFFAKDGSLTTGTGWAGDYYLQDGVPLVGTQMLEDVLYIFDADGAVEKGSFSFEGKQYYANDSGVVLRDGIQSMSDGTLRYFGEDGVAPTGWVDHAENRYYQSTVFVLLTGKQTVEDKIYFFEINGALKTTDGWVEDYYLRNGQVVTGPQTIDKQNYIFDAEGRVQKGHFQFLDSWYFGGDTGALATEAIHPLTNGKSRYFGKDGKAISGWADLAGKKYYQNSTYELVTGRQSIGNSMYFFEADGSLKTTDGWVDGYYLKEGKVLVGRNEIGGKQYIFAADGQVKKGEFTYETGLYYADAAGALYRNVVMARSNGNSTYYDATGLAGLGWIEPKAGVKYYQVASGNTRLLTKGFSKIGADTYYFDSTGKLFLGNANGWYVIGNRQYYLLSDGRYCEPPTISNVTTAYDASAKQYLITIENTISTAAGVHKNGSFSFDGGITWQASNRLVVPASAGASLPIGKIQIRDGVGQSTLYTKAISLAPIGGGVSGSNRGIDVSMYNSNINWEQVAKSGVSFALIRASSYSNNYGGYYIDPYFETNVRNAKAAGMNVGAYIFSYANTIEDIKTEVNFFLNSAEMARINAAGLKFDYPVYIDYESTLNLNGSTYDSRTTIVRTGMQMLEKAGYFPGFYTYKSYMGYFDVAGLVREGYDFWYARYPLTPNPDVNPSSELGVDVGIWQYCSDGNTNPAMTPHVAGINTSLDLNVTYKDYPTKVRAFNGASTGKPPEAVVKDTLTVYDLNSSKVVTDTRVNILSQIVQNEVSGFGNTTLYQAQAVAAHSWILFQLQNGNVAPSVGLKSASSAVKAAVESVTNKIVTYNGTVANTMYGSANSGKTMSSAAMWGGNYPYLAAGIDSPGDLSATVYANSGASWNGRTNTIKLATMASNIEKMVPGSTSGRSDYQNWLTNPTYDANGYLVNMNVMGTTVSAGRFYDNCWGLYSPNFTMKYNGNGSWDFVTKGNGHCVGMSQWGAFGFAKQGQTWDWILKYYYPGTAITTIG